jgi:hypothetical protein
MMASGDACLLDSNILLRISKSDDPRHAAISHALPAPCATPPRTRCLSDWVYRIIQGSEVLTLIRDYFRLRKPIDRGVYELVRKHCGEQDEWKIGLELLHKKTGASSHCREFKSMIRELVQHDHLPDYQVALEDDMVIFKNRMSTQPSKAQVRYPVLDPEAYHDARLVAPSYDVYYLEQEWRDWWVESMMPELGFPGKAFVAFCKKRCQMRPNP